MKRGLAVTVENGQEISSTTKHKLIWEDRNVFPLFYFSKKGKCNMVKKIKDISVCKKIISMLLAVIIVLSAFPFTASAAENLGKVSGGSDISIDVSWHYGHQLHTTTKGGHTYPIFCIEYGTTSPERSYLKAKKAGASAKVITAAKWIFAGYYMEHGNDVNWLDMAYCQKKVWSILGDSTSWDFSDSGYTAWCNQAQANMKSLDTLPSFNAKNVGTIVAGDSLTVTDSNKVLKDYPAFTQDKNGIKIVHESGKNTLKITVDKTCTKTSFAILNDTYYKENTGDDDELLLFYPYGSEDYQKLVYSAYYDPVSFSLTGNITPLGNLALKKTSEDGNVEGIKFTITGTNFSKTVKTDSSGNIKIDELVPGKYTVTEESINKYEPQQAKTVTVKSGETASVTFTNVLKRGDLTVVKTSEDNLVEGVTFKLTGTSLSGEKINLTAKTDAKGVATFKDVLIGSGYTIEEVNTAVRYVVPENQKGDIEWDKVTNKSFVNKLKKFRVEVTKEDVETKSPQGDASLAGAVYGIYKGGDLVDTYTTDKFGKFTTKYYVCGTDWTIQEIASSEGYLVDGTTHKVGADPKDYTIEYNTTKNLVTEQVIKGKIAIIKHSDDGSTQIEHPEAEAEFQVYLKSAGSYDNAKKSERDILDCDNDGFAETKLLPYGVYTVHQTKGKTGADFLPDFDVYIAKEANTYKFLINNAPFKAYAKVVKVDKETGKQIAYAGAGFEIYDPSGKKVSQTFTYPTPTTIDVFYTNAEGYLVTPEKLDFGSGYKLVEVQAPYGYVLDKTPILFDVARESSAEENALTLIKVVKPDLAQKGVIEITKSGEVFSTVTATGGASMDEEGNETVIPVIYTPQYETQNLKDAVYEIYAAEDIKTLDGTVRAKKGSLVDTVTTGKDGLAKSKELYLGKYTVIEKTAPDTMVLNTEKFGVELVYAGQNVKVTSTALSVFNERQKVKVSLKKEMQLDETFGIGNNDEILSVQFGIFANEDVKAADGTVIPKDALVCLANCDKEGNIAFTVDLPIGFHWYAKELATDEHYILSDTKYEFDTEYKGQDVGVIEVNLNEGESIVNELIYGSVKGYKIDRETEKAIKGAVFGLFKNDETDYSEKNAILTAETDADGIFEFVNIPFGKWCIRELKPATGYLENTDIYHFDVERDEKVIEMKIANDLIPELKTTATVDGEKKICATEVFTLTDTVEYKHLIPNKEYVVKGILMDKTTGKALIIDGKEVTSETTFTPEQPSGSVEVTFEFDSKFIKADTDIVVFESLYKEGKELAVHADLEDKGQTVTVKVPTIKTTAKANGKKEIKAKGEITITDTVKYTNLTVGKEYVIKGVLMDKSTGKPFKVDGKEITSQTTFIPVKSNGSIEIKFVFDGSKITKTTELVVFETLYRDGVEVATHSDLKDKGQTVTVTVPETPKKTTPKTGDDRNYGTWIGLGCVALGGAIGAAILYFKRKKEEDE